ncbi:MAG TPA: extracellular solute-binding protein [Gaiellaceae bacterium]|jgi:multiple sugar transport system substrate-binding protein
MKRVGIGLLVALVLGAAAFAATARTQARAGSSAAKADTITIWVGWSARELKEFKKIVAEYDKKNADVNVKVVGGINDDKITAAIRSGNVPDVVSSFTSANVGSYCKSGAWIDLKPLLQKDKIDVNMFPKTTQYYTQYNGKRCALPFLADVYGLYYNKKMFKAAGLKGPPKTMSQLTAYAKKLTKKSSNGTIKVAGYNPFLGFYAGNAPDLSSYAPLFGAKYVDSSGKSMLSRDPAWSRLLKWQKNLVDWYGYKNLQKFNAGAADEFSASHAFEIGKLAMMIDGEWRVAFIQAEHPELSYATAPAPVDDGKPNLYGGGYVNGTIIGIPKGVKHKDQAWKLLKYLTTNAHPLALFSNGIRNVPTTKASLTSKEIKPDAHFKTFLNVFANPNSKTTPITAAGNAYGTLIQAFTVKWQAGHAGDLQSGLKKLDKQIDAQLKQAQAGGVP